MKTRNIRYPSRVQYLNAILKISYQGKNYYFEWASGDDCPEIFGMC